MHFRIILDNIKKGKFLRKNELSQEKINLKKSDWINDVGCHSNLTWCIIWCKMNNTGKSQQVKLLFEANKSLVKLKSITSSICSSQLEKPAGPNIVCYSGATYAFLEDGSWLNGFIIFVTEWFLYVSHQKSWQDNK